MMKFYMSVLFLFMMVFIGTMLTITYSVRLVYYLFIKNLGLGKYIMANEEMLMFYPMFILFFSSILSGSFFNWFFLYPVVVVLPIFMKMMIMTCGGLMIFLMLSCLTPMFLYLLFAQNFKLMTHYVSTMWFLPFLSTIIPTQILKKGILMIKFLDQGCLEEMGGQGFMKKMSFSSSFVGNWSMMNVKSYLMIFLIITVMFMMIM